MMKRPLFLFTRQGKGGGLLSFTVSPLSLITLLRTKEAADKEAPRSHETAADEASAALVRLGR